MKRRAFILLALGGSFAAGLLVGGSAHPPKLPAVNASQAVDAAFRDGVYQAELDIREGRKPRLLIGRWNSAAARALFVAGYQQRYKEFSEPSVGKFKAPSVAELAATGYRDGMLDGAKHRSAFQPFQAEQTANYRDAGLASLEITAEIEEYKRFYREGYLSGYQQAYSSQLK